MDVLQQYKIAHQLIKTLESVGATFLDRQDAEIEVAKVLASLTGEDIDTAKQTTVYNPVRAARQLNVLATLFENNKISKERLITRLRALSSKIKAQT
jgi:hypothetical protein